MFSFAPFRLNQRRRSSQVVVKSGEPTQARDEAKACCEG
jgi:hypothetical protein